MKKALITISILILISGCKTAVNQVEQEPILVPNSSYEPYIL